MMGKWITFPCPIEKNRIVSLPCPYKAKVVISFLVPWVNRPIHFWKTNNLGKTKQKYPWKWFVTRMMFTIHQKRFSFLKKTLISFFYKWSEPSRSKNSFGANRPGRNWFWSEPPVTFDIFWVPLPTQLYFLISSFKYVNNMKTFVCDYHLNDPPTFLHHQIQVCHAHAQMLALEYKNAFSVRHVYGLVILQRRAQIQNL